MAFRFETPVLHTRRLQLRPVRAEDVPQVQAEFSKWAVIKNMTKGVPWPYPADGAKHWFEQAVLKAYANKTESVWAITKREATDRLIGVVSIREDSGDGHRGFWLAESEWGKGYMTEAVTVLNDWVFANTPLTEIVVYNVASNEGSRRVKQKTGAEYVHTIIQDYHCGECESEVWRVDKETWLSRGED